MKRVSRITAFALLFFATFVFLGNNGDCSNRPRSTAGVEQANATVEVGADGLTVEQRNIQKRLERDNAPGSFKHLYVISAYSGQVIIYSTVDGKVSSGGKRLTPHRSDRESIGDFLVPGLRGSGGGVVYTNEIIQDDGTFGSSMDYLYWFDSRGVYHQHYVSGGQIVHISDQPVTVKGIIINMEISQGQER